MFRAVIFMFVDIPSLIDIDKMGIKGREGGREGGIIGYFSCKIRAL